MGLNSTVSKAVSNIDSITADFQVSVRHYPWIGFDSTTGGPSYGSVVLRKGVVDYKQRLRKTSDGQEVTQQASITIPRPIIANGAADRREPVDPRDKFVLPNGYTGPILSIEGIINPSTGTPYAIDVILG